MPPSVSHLYLVDGSSYIYRAFLALPPLNNPNGLPTNAVYGVTTMLLKLVNEARPEAIAIVFDAGGPTFRDEIAEDYKANRTRRPEALRPQLPYVRKVIEAFRLRCLEVPGVEADDVIATLARRFATPSNEVVIVTGDKDLMQLVGPHVSLYMPSGGRGGTLEPRRIGRADVEQRFGVPPEQVVDVMALMGDSIDNIPGVKGIGEKTAQALIQAFGSVDELLARLGEVEKLGLRGAKRVRELLEGQAESARTSRELARPKPDVPIDVTLDDLAHAGSRLRRCSAACSPSSASSRRSRWSRRASRPRAARRAGSRPRAELDAVRASRWRRSAASPSSRSRPTTGRSGALAVATERDRGVRPHARAARSAPPTSLPGCARRRSSRSVRT